LENAQHVNSVVADDTTDAGSSMIFIQGARYFVGVTDAFLYVDPTVAFDTATASLAYGELVHVIKLGGRWAHVQVTEREGWILKDALCEKASDVFPELQEETVYDQGHTETSKLRLCIDDQFGGERAQSVLTDVEYVTYMLKGKGRHVVWSSLRPRIAGTWQKKLRGTEGIHISIVPKTDTVMEYVVDDVGHLCYVEVVSPDESIKISSVGMFEEGKYTSIAIPKAEWIELHPVFIEVQV
jgi:hypothetical protein